MNPDDNQPQPTNMPLQEGVVSSSPSTPQEAATNIVRQQIDTLYTSTPAQQNQAAGSPRGSRPQGSQDQLKQYHNAWQNYYQQYYERYYVSHLEQATRSQQPQPAGSTQMAATQSAEGIDKEEALFDLRNRLLGNIQETAVKVKKSRHFMPIAAAIFVMLLFVFLQYNRIFIANVRAYVIPGNVNPQNIIVDPTVSTSVDPSSTQIIIPKINVDVPVDYNAASDYKSQMAAMNNGLAYFGIPGANSKPGQVGNTPVAGHSSNDVIDPGTYKFIFAQLEKLKKDDVIYANYKGIRYTYIVTRTDVVKPTDVSKLVYKTDKPILTLITCTPIGTALNRLLVTAEQVNPSPAAATQAPTAEQSASPAKVEMPGNSPTIFERLFGAR